MRLAIAAFSEADVRFLASQILGLGGQARLVRIPGDKTLLVEPLELGEDELIDLLRWAEVSGRPYTEIRDPEPVEQIADFLVNIGQSEPAKRALLRLTRREDIRG